MTIEFSKVLRQNSCNNTDNDTCTSVIYHFNVLGIADYYVILFLITDTFLNCTEGSFACIKSKRCIDNEFVCDGRVHCKVNGSYAEDEDFNLCQTRKVFSKGASIECNEAYRPDSAPIRINATYCDSHIECINNKDGQPEDEPYHCLPTSGKLRNKYLQYIFPTTPLFLKNG
jgi:hypothetical protein